MTAEASIRSASALRREAVPASSLALLATVVLATASLLHIGFGAAFVPPLVAIDSVLAFEATNFDHQIIQNLRLPRLCVALAVGACLGLAGATIQAVTRNPLAGPGILGMNAGAALAVVVCLVFIGPVVMGFALPWIAAAGSIAVFAIVIGLSSAGRAGPTPLKITLAGVAVSVLVGAVTSAILILDENTLETVRLWLAGNLAGRSLQTLGYAAPAMLLGAALALASAPALNAMALGEQAATGLGVAVRRTRLVCLVAVALMAGAAVSAAGPIGFLGLVVPHAVKLFVPTENRLILPLSAIVGAATLVLADLAARVVLAPQEIATGIITVLIGAPIFVVLVRTRL